MIADIDKLQKTLICTEWVAGNKLESYQVYIIKDAMIYHTKGQEPYYYYSKSYIIKRVVGCSLYL